MAQDYSDDVDHPATVGHLRTAQTNAPVSSTGKQTKRACEAQAIKLLPKLVQSACWGHREDSEAVGQSIAAVIESTHPAIARSIRKHLGSMLRPTRVVHRPEELVDFREGRHDLSVVLLPDDVERECRSIVQEHQKAAELAKYHLAPRHKVLLSGPPGNGKTLLAEGLAKELDVPFLTVQYTGLVESYLGSTGKNLQKIFDYASQAPCLLFMDEFDGVAIDRGDSKDVGEIRRVTNQLLLLMDKLPSTTVLVAATNADELLDRAIKRRFDFSFHLPQPSLELRRRCAERELASNIVGGRDLATVIEAIAVAPLTSLSAIVKGCERIRRDIALNGGQGIPQILQFIAEA